MRPSADLLSDHFLDAALASALRHLPPHERRALRAEAFIDWTDDRGHEPTVTLSVRVPVSFAVRIDIERGALKRKLGRRRLSRSEAIRALLCAALAEHAEPEALIVGAEPFEVPEQAAA